MEFVPANCPNCGAPLMLPKGTPETKCSYCGSTFVVTNATLSSPVPAVANWENLANSALQGKNYVTAYEYFNKILEVDCSNLNAWMGKAYSTGMLSLIANSRLLDMVISYGNAYKLVDGSNANALEVQITDEITKILDSAIAIDKKFILNNPSTQNWSTAVNYGGKILQAAEKAASLFPPFRLEKLFEKIISFCEYLLKGISFTDTQKKRQALPLHPLDFDYVCKHLKDTEAIYKTLQPDYQPVKIPGQNGGCFIATATLGNPNHPGVRLLRVYRDQVLQISWYGRLFIKIYYLFSPYCAKIIEHSKLLKKICMVLIVNPWIGKAEKALGKMPLG